MKRLVLVLLSLFLLVLPCSASQYKNLIRVGISTNNFKRLCYSSITISSSGGFEFYNKESGKSIMTVSPYKWIRVTFSGGKFNLFLNGNLLRKKINGPLGIRTKGFFRVKGLKRKGKRALYRGEFELVQSHNNKTKFNLVNVLAMEKYLKGVVPNEIPISFGLEAVKAQAVAARNYTLRPRVKVYHNFDVCDTVHSQVYFGKNTEQEVANDAIKATKGLFALYNGEVILSVYSSTAGGHTENFENVFTSPISDKFPSEPIPYLKGKPDFPLNKKISLTKDKQAEEFYKSCPKSFDINSKYYRWNKEWTRKELECVLSRTLASYSGSGFVLPKFSRKQSFGKLKSIRVLSRGVSGKVISLEVKTSKGIWVIKKELIIRRIFKKCCKSLPSANFIIENVIDKKGNLLKVKFIGGGFGHGVGMSQYGAGKMSKDGYKFNEILQHYYTGVSIGTYPVRISDKPIAYEFSSPDKKGVLVIDNPERVENFVFKINSVEINLDKSFMLKKNRLKLKKYMKENNIVEFLPVDETGKNLKVWIEVFKASDEK